MTAEPPVREQPVAVLRLDGVELTLLGTAHVSRSSAETVAAMIDSGDYHAVAIELDSGRLAAITDADAWAKTDLMKVLREGKAGMLAINLALSAFQQRLADQFGVEPGAEMRAAVSGARRHGLELLLIDRDIGVTLRRVYASVGWWQRMTLVAGMLASTFSSEKIEEEDIERLKEGDILESTFTEFAERSERIYTPLITERDQYMTTKLLQYAARWAGRGAEPRRVLVVVGAGHLKGMRQGLVAAGAQEAAADDADDDGEPSERAGDVQGGGNSTPVGGEVSTPHAPITLGSTASAVTVPPRDELSATITRLETTPPTGRWVKAIPWLILVVVLAGFVVGFLRSPEQGVQLLTDWTLITAGLAGIGTLIALAHPVTILATMIAAPFTTLNPFLGAGFVAAGVELWLRKPSVGDFERLKRDVATWRGWWSNRAARVLLVFVLATLGASAGTFVAGARIFGRLVG